MRRLAESGLRLAVASSSNRELIDAVLRRLELADLFAVTVSSEEVARGKPAPDVYLGRARDETELPVVLSSIGSAETAAGEESCLERGLPRGRDLTWEPAARELRQVYERVAAAIT